MQATANQSTEHANAARLIPQWFGRRGWCLALGASSSFAADSDWPSYGNDLASTKYAPLDQIDARNVDELGVAWTWESPDNSLGLFPGPFKSTPIKIGDDLFVSTSVGHVAALDAATGKQRWVFDTGSWRRGTPPNLGYNHRGVAYWERDDRRRVLMPTNDGYLWSLDAVSGRPDPAFGNEARVDLTQGLGRPVSRGMYSVVSPPLVVGDLAIVGSVVADEWSTRRPTDYPPGDVRAFDVRTGDLRWRFHSIPRPGETGHQTWLDGSWKEGGAVNVWTLMSADHELGYVYLPFGTPSNDWYGGHRPGDNLFGESLVCLEAATGKLVWFYQTVHHGLWDYDLPGGRQYIVFATGQGNRAGVTALALRPDRAIERAVSLPTALTSREPDGIYAAICARCHDDAVGGAPRPGHTGDWEGRLSDGVERVVARTIEGMPPYMPAVDCATNVPTRNSRRWSSSCSSVSSRPKTVPTGRRGDPGAPQGARSPVGVLCVASVLLHENAEHSRSRPEGAPGRDKPVPYAAPGAPRRGDPCGRPRRRVAKHRDGTSPSPTGSWG